MSNPAGIDAIASANNPAQPMLVLFAHDGDNAWSGGYSYYNENVTQFAHAAAGQGYTPTTVARAAPDERPKSMTAVAMATSKWFDAPIIADGAASS